MNTITSKKNPVSRLTKGYLICLFATVMWATTAIFIRYLTENFQLPAMALAFWRDTFVAIALAVVFCLVHPEYLHIEKEHTRFLLLYGVVLAAFNASWTLSVALNGAAVSTVLAYSSAAYTAIMGWRLFGESLNPTKLVAVSMGLTGCILVAGAYDPSAWRLNPVGILTGIVSGILFACYSLMGKASANRGISSWSALLYSFAVAAVMLLIYNLAANFWPSLKPSADLFKLGSSLTGWVILFILAVVPTIGGYGFYTLSLTYLPVSIANLIALLEPGITAILAFVILGEVLTSIQLVGSLLVIAGVVILRLRETENPANP